MAEKGKIKKSIKELQRIKTWQLVVLLVIVGFVAATFLRLNSIGMVQRRTAVITGDKEGDQNTIIQRLYDLQQYVSSHMNTDLGRGVYLEASYNRAVQSWAQTQYGDADPNGNIYKKAQDVCAPQFKYYSYAYLECTMTQLQKYPAAKDPANSTSKPPQQAYIYDFESPLWTPDFAGWSVIVFLFILLLIVIRLVSLGILQLMLKRRYKRI